jgi:hypothetical protein
MKDNYLLQSSVLKTTLVALLGVFFATETNGQNDYSVASIPYQVYQATAPVQGTMDDTFSAPIPLTFDFDFYGNTYNQVNISTNGYISFNAFAQGDMSPWSFNSQIPDADFEVKNAFLGCYHDLNNSNSEGTITYAILGSAPYRKFVVMFDNNSHFQCSTSKSSFQMILYETLNIMDVQIIDKQLCTWNAGAGVTGIINNTGLLAVTPAGRNTAAWTAFHEGWRFQRPLATNAYLFAKCDDDTDGFVSFNLQVVQNDLAAGNPSSVNFYSTESDAISQSGAFTDLNYTNTVANEAIYANVNGEVKKITLRVVDCNNDYDLDSVATADEDLNADTNLANDDTDGDGIPNFTDNDDDGDMVLTSVEYVFNRNANGVNSYLDSDNDGILNYLDNDDDGDGTLTIDEDANGNNNPADDDADANGIPDYLQYNNLAVNHFQNDHTLVLYPNPADAVLNIKNISAEKISKIAIYSTNGALIKETGSAEAISVSELQSGIYFVKIISGDKVHNAKFIKK